jgi:hypothetical protein
VRAARAVLAVTVLIGLATSGPFAVGAGAQTDPVTPAVAAITVTPDTVLVDLQSVTVDLSGYSPGGVVSLSQCVLFGGGAGGVCHGATRTEVTVDQGGAATTPFVVRRVLMEAAAVVDCVTAAEGCGIVASQALQPTMVAPLTFDPAVPPAGPTLTVSPATDLRDGQVVEARGAGFTPNERLKLAQCPAPSVAFATCDLTAQVFVDADASGAFTLGFAVRVDIRAGGPDPTDVDCDASPGACTITAGVDRAASEHAAAPLTFATTGDGGILPRTGARAPALTGIAVALVLAGLGLLTARLTSAQAHQRARRPARRRARTHVRTESERVEPPRRV